MRFIVSIFLVVTLFYFVLPAGVMTSFGKLFDTVGADSLAMHLYRKAAEDGNASAQNNLGSMYANGQGVIKNDQWALHWYRKAADQGQAYAQNNLGNMYQKGIAVPKDDQWALHWYRKAAEQGQASAQKNLGLMYVNSKVAVVDYQQAYFWLLLASASGIDDAVTWLPYVEAKLSQFQRDSAQAQARDWKPRKQ